MNIATTFIKEFTHKNSIGQCSYKQLEMFFASLVKTYPVEHWYCTSEAGMDFSDSCNKAVSAFPWEDPEGTLFIAWFQDGSCAGIQCVENDDGILGETFITYVKK